MNLPLFQKRNSLARGSFLSLLTLSVPFFAAKARTVVPLYLTSFLLILQAAFYLLLFFQRLPFSCNPAFRYCLPSAFCRSTVPVLFFLLCELSCIKLIILPFFLHKLFMVSPFNNPSLFHNHDAISILDGRQPVGYHKCRPPLHQFIHAPLYQFLRPGIDGGCGFIQDKDGGIG